MVGRAGAVVLEVEDLSDMREKLTQNGVKVNDIVDMSGHGQYFTAVDPAGNIVQIFARS